MVACHHHLPHTRQMRTRQNNRGAHHLQHLQCTCREASRDQQSAVVVITDTALHMWLWEGAHQQPPHTPQHSEKTLEGGFPKECRIQATCVAHARTHAHQTHMFGFNNQNDEQHVHKCNAQLHDGCLVQASTLILRNAKQICIFQAGSFVLRPASHMLGLLPSRMWTVPHMPLDKQAALAVRFMFTQVGSSDMCDIEGLASQLYFNPSRKRGPLKSVVVLAAGLPRNAPGFFR